LLPWFSPPQRYGSMRSRRPASSARTWFVCRRLRFRLVAFLVRMWLRLAWPALYLPEAVFRKRLAAPRCVLILGIAMSLGSFRVLARAAPIVGTLSVLPGRFASHWSRRSRGRVRRPRGLSPDEPGRPLCPLPVLGAIDAPSLTPPACGEGRGRSVGRAGAGRPKNEARLGARSPSCPPPPAGVGRAGTRAAPAVTSSWGRSSSPSAGLPGGG